MIPTRLSQSVGHATVPKHQEKLPALSGGQVLILPGFAVASADGPQHRVLLEKSRLLAQGL